MVESDTGDMLQFNGIGAFDTIAKVKGIIQRTTGIPQDNQRLLVHGKELEDDKTLADQYIGNGAFLHLSLRENVKTLISLCV